jgi:REP element-mobilizing transposase RayT
MRGYKSAVTRQLGLNGNLWQRNYYESIIRDEISHKNIMDYIIQNPAKWMNDQFYGL